MGQNLYGRAAAGPTGCRRLLIFGYYDGATDGVLETASGEVYRFDFVDEVRDPDGRDRRTFLLRPLPADALDRLAAVIAPYIPPAWPDWLPIWRFPDDAVRAEVESQMDAILDEAGPERWEVTADGLSSATPFADVRPVATPTIPT